MKDLAVVVGLTAALLLATAGVVMMIDRPAPQDQPDPPNRTEPLPKPHDTTPRLIVAEPTFYEGRRVRVASDGFQPGLDASTIVFRKRADELPVLICTFEKPVPLIGTKLPAKFTGVVKIVDGVPHLTGCVPE